MAGRKLSGKVLAIVAAAGKAERMGLKNGKALLRLGGVPCIAYSVLVLERVREISEIVIVCPEGQEERVWAEAVRPFGVKKVKKILPGGATRQESVRVGLEYARLRGFAIVLVHDAARPLVQAQVVKRCLQSCRTWGAAVAAIPVSETLKRGDGFVVETVERKNTWIAQTPQVFRLSVLWRAHERARKDGFTGSDDASLVERIGGKVAIVPGSRTNLKVTYPEDADIVEALVKNVRS